MREDVITWLRHGCEYEQGIKLLKKHMVNRYYLQTIVMRGDTRENKAVVEYELCKLAGVKKAERKKIKELGAEGMEHKEETAEEESDKESVVKMDVSLRGEDLKKAIEKNANAEQNVKRVKLRDEFPFLKRNDCPDEFKILVSDMLTCHENFITGHSRLFDCTSIEECFETVRFTVESYLENRQCWEELEYYRKHNKVLGEHKVFAELMKLEKLRAMNPVKMVKHMQALKRNIWRNNDAIKKNPESEANKDRMLRIKELEKELEVVEKLIGSE